jgi:predicted site-specific integrase-resolvase
MPVHAERLPSGTILVRDPVENPVGDTVMYARVSSYDQWDGLDAQVSRVTAWCAVRG